MEKGDLQVQTSYLTSMDIWFVAMKTFSVLSLIESLVVLALIKRRREMVVFCFVCKNKIATKIFQDRLSQIAVNEYQREFYEAEKRRLKYLYHKLDLFSRFISPLVFILFFFYYVVYVAKGDERKCLSKSNL